MKKLNKIYLGIPYSKMDLELSYKIANEMFAYFLKKGNNVFSPITHSHPLTKMGFRGDWNFWRDCDHQFIDWCNEIIIIIPPDNDGFSGIELIESSTGIEGELEYANKINRPHRFFDYNTKNFVKIPEKVFYID